MTTYLNASRSVSGSLLNESVAAQVANATDTYLTGSQIAPVHVPARTGSAAITIPARSHFVFKGVMTKTAAGIAAPVFKIRIGSVGTIADAIRVTLTSPAAQTAAADSGCFEILAMVRAIGTACVISASLKIGHDLLDTGFAIRPTPFVNATGASFDLDAIGDKPFIGLSVDPGASGVWTFESMIAEMKLT